MQTVRSNKFPGEASAFFKTCLETVASKIEESKRHNREVNLDVYDLSVGHFNGNGQAFVTWIISPYYYCPMDEDGFGEDEEFEVAITCHINTNGQLIDTPVWKP